MPHVLVRRDLQVQLRRPPQAFQLAVPQPVVGEEVHRRIWSQSGGEAGRGGDVLIVVVVAGDHGHPHGHGHAEVPVNMTDVVQDQFIGDPGVRPVLLRVHVLHVQEPQVHVGEDPIHGLPGGEDAGLHRRVETGLPGRAEQGLGKGRMGQEFPAAEGHAAAGGVQEQLVLQHPVQHLLHGHFLPGDLPGVRGADGDAGPAVHAEAPVRLLLHGPLQLREAHRLFGAGFDAGPAARALRVVGHELGGGGIGLRIGAPEAAQGAALQEHGDPDARAVMDGIALDVEYGSLAAHLFFGHGNPSVSAHSTISRGKGQAGGPAISPAGALKNGHSCVILLSNKLNRMRS